MFTTDIIDLLEEKDFKCSSFGEHVERPYSGEDDYFAELEWYSPAGEDVVVPLWYDGTDKGFIDAFYDYSVGFDADEHAEMWVDGRGKNGVPSTIRELLVDAEAIQKHLTETADALMALYRDGR